jgi:hypothetical protein
VSYATTPLPPPHSPSPDGHEIEDVRHSRTVTQEAANADLEHNGDHQDPVPAGGGGKGSDWQAGDQVGLGLGQSRPGVTATRRGSKHQTPCLCSGGLGLAVPVRGSGNRAGPGAGVRGAPGPLISMDL